MEIRRAALDEIVAHARQAWPNECCGLLIGTQLCIEHAHRARNLEDSPTRFQIDPRDHFAAIHAARADGGEVVGAYHSHPSTPAAPSATDALEASYLEYLCVIVSPLDEPADVRAFRPVEGGFREVRLVVRS